MRKPDDSPREPMSEHPQPLAGPGEQQPQHFQEEDEADAFSRWLAHVEAGGLVKESKKKHFRSSQQFANSSKCGFIGGWKKCRKSW